KPPADGFYYAQVKNVGDIGAQQILYDLTLAVCVPQQEPFNTWLQCTSKEVSETKNPPKQVAAPSGAAGIAPDVAGFVFLRLWQRNDQRVVANMVKRSWTWGPSPLRQMSERYDQAPGGMRQVVYFDKGRMEVNNPADDQNSPWFVTSGRLVVELIT